MEIIRCTKARALLLFGGQLDRNFAAANYFQDLGKEILRDRRRMPNSPAFQVRIQNANFHFQHVRRDFGNEIAETEIRV